MTSLRYALRSLKRSPGFVTIAVLALGIGLGLSATMFAVLDAVVHPYVAYRDPGSLFGVRWWFNGVHGATGHDLYRELSDAVRDLGTMTPAGFGRGSLETGDESRDVFLAYITPDFFTVTGLRPRMGRGLIAADGEQTAVVSDGLWRRSFPKRSSVDGATITLRGVVYTVVGVMPRGAIAPGLADVWIPLRHGSEPVYPGPISQLLRLKPGVTKTQMEARLAQLGVTLTARWGSRERPISVQLTPVTLQHEDVRDIHKAMVGAAVLVLLIACANLAHLMLARGLSRRREVALRMALGASRASVTGQMFLECALITVAGSALGAVGSTWGVDVLVSSMPRDVSWVGLIQPQLSWRTFLAMAIAAALSAVLFGLLPAIRVARSVNLDDPLKDGAGTTTRTRARYSPLVISEVALALVLMMGGGLMLRTVRDIQQGTFSFDATTLVNASVGLRGPSRDSSKMMRRDALIAMLADVPDVRQAALIVQRFTAGGAVTAEMEGGDSVRTIAMRQYSGVSWQYFGVYGLAILKGRDFAPGDESGPGVAILNAIAAQRLYPRGDAVGHMIKLGAPARDARWVRIIGISRTAQAISGADATPPDPEVAVAQPDIPVAYADILVRTVRQDPRIAVAIRRKLLSDPGIAVFWVEPYLWSRNGELASRGFLAGVFVSMGTVALGLAVLGLYGVLAYAVSQRMREFAVRSALGAQTSQIFGMVLHDGAIMILAGTGIGAFAALFLARMLDAVLIGVLPYDVTSLVLSEVVLIAAGFAAALTPARRASRADPMQILRAS